MSYEFDDLARAIARGISRRQALKRMGAGLAGMLLVSLGIRKALAAVSCGTCQACDLDTNTCGLPCSPATAGQSLCTMASSDGSYLRLVNFLTLHGFASAGTSDSIIFNQGGQLQGSALTTNFTSESESALVMYSVGPNGDIFPFAIVSQDNVAIYGLSVDFNGRIVQTVFTQQITSSSTSSDSDAPSGKTQSAQQPGVKALTVTPLFTTLQAVCTAAAAKACSWVVLGFIECEAIGSLFCAAISGPEGEAPFPFCEFIITTLCSTGSKAACVAAAAKLCSCGGNQACADPAHPLGCCPTCNDCVNGVLCSPKRNNATCSSTTPGAVCCNGQCCPNGYTCDTTTTPPTCTSPNSGCLGATCETFVPCSSSNPDCVCGTITEGGGLCVPGSTPCAGLTVCANSGDCGSEALCLIGSCCGDPVCVPISLSAQCPATTDASAVKSQVQKPRVATGPTLGHR